MLQEVGKMYKKKFSKILSVLLITALVFTYNSGFALSVWAAGEDVPAAAEEMSDDAAQAESGESNDGSDADLQNNDQQELPAYEESGDPEDINAQESNQDSADEVESEDAVSDEQQDEQSAEDVAEAEEASAEQSKDADSKTEYVYSDNDIEVTATFSDASVMPDDAVLVVTPVTSTTDGYNFDAYMEALNESVGASKDNGGKGLFSKLKNSDKAAKQYTEDNTILYDIAFIVDENGEKTELQPEEGTVSINMQFINKQLTEHLGAETSEDVQLIHLPLREAVREDYNTTKEATDIKASEIEVEPVDVEVSVGKRECTKFALEGLSILAVTTNPDKFGTTDQDSSQVNHLLALGRAVEYGIVADTYDQKNHQQTNFAVKHFSNSGQINGEPDLAGTWNVPYQIGEITKNKLRFGTSTYQGNVVQYDVYLPKTYEQSINSYVQIDGGGKDKVNIVYEDVDTINKNIDSMLNGAKSKSDILKKHSTTITLTNDVVRDQNQLVVDTTNYPDNAVIYLNIPDTADYSMIRTVLKTQAAFHLHKKPNQVVVVNILGTSDVELKKMIVTLPGEDKNTKDDRFSSLSPNGQNAPVNDRIDEQIAQKVIWNIPEAKTVNLDTSAGIFLVPSGDVNVKGTSAGWIVSGGKVTTDGCEFHYLYRDRHYTPQTMADATRNLRFTAYKGLKDATGKEIGLNGKTFAFSLYETGENFDTAGKVPIETVQSSALATANFSSIQYTESEIESRNNGDYYYVIKEQNAGETENGVTNWDGQINIKLHADVADNKVSFKLQYYRYQTKTDVDNNTPENVVRVIDVAGEEFTLGRVFNQYNATTTLSLGAKKQFDGHTPEEGAFEFTVTEVADEQGTAIVPAEGVQVYTDTAVNDADGNVSFQPIEYSASDASTDAEGEKHYYKIVETSKNSDSINYDNSEHIVTVTVKDNGSGTLTAEADKTADQIVFNNSTKTGKLVITKTVDGDNITESEFEGALKFTVQNKDGKYLDKDGNLSDSKVELTLKDGGFVKGEDGKYTKTFENVEVGEYTVTETNTDVSGYTLVANKSTTSGDTTVEKDGTATVELKDTYEKDKGSFELKKTIKGDITEEEAEGALTFEITTGEGESKKWLKADGSLSDSKVELTLKDFTHEGGKNDYVLTIDKVLVGTYNVTETTKDVNGKDVSVSYTVGDGESQTGDSAEATVTKDQKTEVAFEDNYTDHKGDLIIKKTVGGDVTKEEVEKAAITFEVTTTVKGEDGEEVTARRREDPDHTWNRGRLHIR